MSLTLLSEQLHCQLVVRPDNYILICDLSTEVLSPAMRISSIITPIMSERSHSLLADVGLASAAVVPDTLWSLVLPTPILYVTTFKWFR